MYGKTVDVTTVYLLHYSEEWQELYTSTEVFTDEETRDRRIEFIEQNYRDLKIFKEDFQMDTPWDSPLADYKMDSEEDAHTSDPISDEMAAFVEMKVRQFLSGELNLSQPMSSLDFDRKFSIEERKMTEFKYRYDRNTGEQPQIGDRVEAVHLGENTPDGLFKGTYAATVDYSGITGIVILDQPGPGGELAMLFPVTCLRKLVMAETDTTSIKLDSLDPEKQTEIFLQAFDRQLETGIHLDPPELDSDGYIIWKGGDYRPVDKNAIVAVKVRGDILRDPVRAGLWPRICWMHRHADNEMNKWDIVAYKILR